MFEGGKGLLKNALSTTVLFEVLRLQCGEVVLGVAPRPHEGRAQCHDLRGSLHLRAFPPPRPQ